MKHKITVLLLVLNFSLFAQQTNIQSNDCEVLTNNVIGTIAEKFSTYQLDSLYIITHNLIVTCGISECTQRLIVLEQIYNKKNTESAIKMYFENNLQDYYWNRIYNSAKLNFGYIYSSHKEFYQFVPLRHRIDSVTNAFAIKLLDRTSLNNDEKLICIMFSSNYENFEKEIEKSEYNESFIKKYLRKRYRDAYKGFNYNIYTGFFKPLKQNDVFSYSPIIGFTFGAQIYEKYTLELGFKYRINSNDKSFEYFALGKTHTVNSKTSIFGGLLLGYKMYEAEKIIVTPKFGLGIEVVNTGISETKNNNQDTTYYDIETLHVSLGLSAMIPVLKRNYLGFGVNYHFCPYSYDYNLVTEFSNHLWSTEIFWRF